MVWHFLLHSVVQKLLYLWIHLSNLATLSVVSCVLEGGLVMNWSVTQNWSICCVHPLCTLTFSCMLGIQQCILSFSCSEWWRVIHFFPWEVSSIKYEGIIVMDCGKMSLEWTSCYSKQWIRDLLLYLHVSLGLDARCSSGIADSSAKLCPRENLRFANSGPFKLAVIGYDNFFRLCPSQSLSHWWSLLWSK